MDKTKPFPVNSVGRQRGVALMVAMIALVVMALAGVALVRSVDTNALVAGNLAFRQASSNSGDIGIEVARSWIMANGEALTKDNAAAGYYATRMNAGGSDGKGIDLTGSRTSGSEDDVKWLKVDGSAMEGRYTPSCVAAKDAAGNKVCYVIHRLCDNTGALEDAGCSSSFSGSSGGASSGALQQLQTYQKTIVGEGVLMGFYRVTVRISGPRNNASYIQAVVQF